MKPTYRINLFSLGLLIGLGIVPLAGGCSKDKDTAEIMTLDGRIESIDLRAKEVSVLYYSKKHKEDTIGIGRITDETEIMINGAIAKLADLRAGDRVHGEVRVEKKGEKRDQIALRISVDRPTASAKKDG